MITVLHNGERYELDGNLFCSISRRAAMLFANPATKLPLDITEKIRGESFRALVETIRSGNITQVKNPLLVLEAALEWRCDPIVTQIERQLLQSGRIEAMTSALLFTPPIGDHTSSIERYVAEHFDDFLAERRFPTVLPSVLHRILSWYDIDLSRHPRLFDFLREVLRIHGTTASLLFQCVDLLAVPIEKVTELVLDPLFDPSFVADQLEEVAEVFEQDLRKESQEPQVLSAVEDLEKEVKELKAQLVADEAVLEQAQERLKLLEKSRWELEEVYRVDIAGGYEQLRRVGEQKVLAERNFRRAEEKLAEIEQPWKDTSVEFARCMELVQQPLVDVGSREGL